MAISCAHTWGKRPRLKYPCVLLPRPCLYSAFDHCTFLCAFEPLAMALRHRTSALIVMRGGRFWLFLAPKKKGRAPRLSPFPFSTGTLARPCSRDLFNRQSCRRGCSRLQHLSCAACPPQTWSSLEDRTCSTRSPLDSCDHVSTAHTARWQ